MQRLTPTGATAICKMVPAATLPAEPASRARARISTEVSPASRVPASTVSNRVSPAVMHTVPAAISRSAGPAVSTVNRSTPSATVGSRRSTPRSWAWRSRYSPWAVWGKHCRFTQSHWT